MLSLQLDFGKLLETGEGADVTLTVGPQKLPAHSIVLRARSNYFKVALDQEAQWEEASTREFDVTDAGSAECVQAVLKYMYTDVLPETRNISLIIELYSALDYLIIPAGIAKLCAPLGNAFVEESWANREVWMMALQASQNAIGGPLLASIIPKIAQLLQADSARRPTYFPPAAPNAKTPSRKFFSETMERCAYMIKDSKLLIQILESNLVKRLSVVDADFVAKVVGVGLRSFLPEAQLPALRPVVLGLQGRNGKDGGEGK
ncbi:hypothetical protein HDV00_000521 [Rhizophlyctis rosea]|nr:hypothetical protein HDV00_000521 [Rhizophlyctis rosea]